MTPIHVERGHHRSTAALRIGIADLMGAEARGTAYRMFTDLVTSADPALDVYLFDPLEAVPRTSAPNSVRLGWEELAGLDALIVTGAEPSTDRIEADQTWPLITRIIENAAAGPVSVVFSCFSAHAALHMRYSLPRTPLTHKRCGVFVYQVTDPASCLLAGTSDTVAAPQSRWNTVALDELVRAGVRPLATTPDGDWHLAVSSDGLREVFLQGHPEYRTDMLLREYRRDVRRFLSAETSRYPTLPVNYFDAAAVAALEDFRARAIRRRDLRQLETFPHAVAAAGLRDRWLSTSRTMFRNWLGQVTLRRNGVSM